jgi:hypothetical protein
VLKDKSLSLEWDKQNCLCEDLEVRGVGSRTWLATYNISSIIMRLETADDHRRGRPIDCGRYDR